MAEQVTGSIGQEQVVFNNAASEATLLKLLEAVKAQAGAAAAAKTANLASSAGVDPATVEKVNNSLNRANTTLASGVNPALVNNASAIQNSNQQLSFWDQAVQASSNVLKSFARGGATTTSVLDAFGQLPGPVGLVSRGFAELSRFQNENLLALRSMSTVGVTFAGALTNIRIAATNAYLDLSQFSNVVRNNADVFATMGGSAQDGVDQFVKIQNKLLAPGSDTANNLATLGYSFEDAANLTALYMRTQGSMNKEGLKNTTEVTKAVQGYAQELSYLSELTGKSREEIQKNLQKESMEANWKNLLARMSPDEAAKATKRLAEAQMQGQGAVDYFKAKMMGFPPLTEQGQLFAATQRAGTAALDDYVKTTKDASISSEEADKRSRAALAKALADGAGDMDRMRSVLQASGLTGGALAKTLADAQNLQTSFMKDGKMMSESEIAARLEKMATDKKQAASEAASVQEGEARMKKLYAAFLDLISPLVTVLTPALKYLGPIVLGLAATIVAVNLAMKVYQGIMATMAIIERAKMARDLAALSGGGLMNFAKQFAGLGPGKASPVAAVASTTGGVVANAASSTVASKAGGVVSNATGSVGGGIGGAISGILSGLAEGLKKLGNPQVMLGAVTLGLLAADLWIASQGLENFAKISWESMAKGFVTLLGLGAVAAILSAAAPVFILGAVSLGILGGALWITSKGLENFANISWASVSKGLVTLLGLGAVAAVLSFASPLIIAGSIAIGILGVALIPFGYAMSLVGKAMESFSKSLNELAGIDGNKLVQLGKGLLAVSAGMLAFTAASVVGGIGAIGARITNFFSGGGPIGLIKSAIETLTPVMPNLLMMGPALKEFSEGINSAFTGINSANIKEMAVAIKELSVSMLAFTAASVVGGIGALGARIANFFSGGGPIGLIKSAVLDLTPIMPQLLLLGPALKQFSEGINTAFGDADTSKIKEMADAIRDLGSSFVAFSSGSLVGGLAGVGTMLTNFLTGGGPVAQIKSAVAELSPILPELVQIGPAINSYAEGIVAFGKAVNSVDIAKAEQLKKALGPSAVESIANAGTQLIKAATGAIGGKSTGEEKTATELAALNNTMKDILRYMKDTADNTKKNIDATRALNGNLFTS